uniref:ORF69 n=1 Tax=Malaco herpesvirus 4 TaxID=3031800 RepID=A0AA48P7P8_9VIRU|nr:TPA_asm: ORF69 [Malaco herpesvirus 4]
MINVRSKMYIFPSGCHKPLENGPKICGHFCDMRELWARWHLVTSRNYSKFRALWTSGHLVTSMHFSDNPTSMTSTGYRTDIYPSNCVRWVMRVIADARSISIQLSCHRLRYRYGIDQSN